MFAVDVMRQFGGDMMIFEAFIVSFTTVIYSTFNVLIPKDMSCSRYIHAWKTTTILCYFSIFLFPCSNHTFTLQQTRAYALKEKQHTKLIIFCFVLGFDIRCTPHVFQAANNEIKMNFLFFKHDVANLK